MGCKPSKSVSNTSATAPKRSASFGSKSSKDGNNNRKRDAKAPQAPHSPKKSPKRKGSGTPRKTAHDNGIVHHNRNSQPIDDSWTALWDSLHTHILDPADVYAFMADAIAKTTNKLSPTEVTFLVRRIRQVTRNLPKPNPTHSTNKMINRFMPSKPNGVETPDGRMLVEKFHQMDEVLLKSVFSAGDSIVNGTESLDLLGTTFVLASHLSCEAFWNQTSLRAADAAENAGLVLDVNKDRTREGPPPPPIGTREYAFNEPVEVTGANLLSVAFLVALGLRGTREQRLQLLFYLCLPPKTLKGFMSLHPAGGLPTWLLEVGGDIIISLASLTHYYYYGKAFVPGPAKPSSERRKKVTIATQEVMPMIARLLRTTVVPTIEVVESFNGEKSHGSNSRNGGANFLTRRASNGNDSTANSSTATTQLNKMALTPPPPPTPSTQYLQDVREGVEMIADQLPNSKLESYWTVCKQYDGVQTWRLDQFQSWAEQALDDETLDMIFRRLYGTGVLPSSSMEKELVTREWKDWQTSDIRLWSRGNEDPQDPMQYLSRSVQRVLSMGNGDSSEDIFSTNRGWGGIGGFDGRGGLGYGIMYIVDKKWWDAWKAFVGWSWDEKGTPRTLERPPDLSNEALLDRLGSTVAGSLGSYEIMKVGLKKGVDYVLVPPSVWDVLYELYGGGPPLPRMILNPPAPPIVMSNRDRTLSTDSKQMEDGDQVELILESKDKDDSSKLVRIPEALMVETHPWVFHCHLCDASQPHRLREAGTVSIRIMAAPGQKLWRLYAEIIVRLQLQDPRAIGKDGRGKARLWKRTDQTAKDPSVARFGPWTLLCKGRSAIWPILNQEIELEDNYKNLVEDWESFADHATVEGVGLTNGDRMMLEYAVIKNGEFVWPREAAAKAGRARRLAEEEVKLRRILRGVDEKGEPLKDPPPLEGMILDAMDSRRQGWFQVEILKVRTKTIEEPGEADEEDIEDESKEGASAEGDAERTRTREIKLVCVDFSGSGGNIEWIDVESDRLTVAGKMAVDKPEQVTATKGGKKDPPDAKNKKEVAKKATENDQNTGKICTLPGYGACGLANLGNTCYANSAIQCISYMPLLRSYLLSAQYKANGDLNKDNPLGTGGKLLENFVELLKYMWSGKYGERQPRTFRNQLGQQCSDFAGADQQDAQELLNYMLDVLHEDSNRVKNKPAVEALEDDWVKSESLARVGEESWRRFLRRNRSIMADVVMGQVLNTVTCPSCGFSSRNFDPFNLLSLPFPTVADVIFQCTVFRRATSKNCPKVLNRKKQWKREGRGKNGELKPPSEHFVREQYVIAMSRLADIGDLRLKLQNISGIPAGRLRLCRSEKHIVDKQLEDGNPIKTYTKVTSLPDKEGPCFHFAKNSAQNDDRVTSPAASTRLYAFEATLSPRPLPPAEIGPTDDTGDDDTVPEDDEDDEEEEEELSKNHSRTVREFKHVNRLIKVYGDEKECRLHDTEALTISKAISRSLWPRVESEFKLGLRVDAIDHKGHWFSGSVLEIVEGVPQGDERGNSTKREVKIHFDNFASRWDESYTIDDFRKNHVRPLYSHATPRPKPAEFMVHNRYLERGAKAPNLFGQVFPVQCQNEWTTARAGAHILAQASRFLNSTGKEVLSGPIDVDAFDGTDSRALKVYEKYHAAISELIDVLIEYDRTYVRAALGVSDKRVELRKDFSNPKFDASPLCEELASRVEPLLHKLPFEMKVCPVDTLAGKKGSANNEERFPLQLIRTIGNFANVRLVVVLDWKDIAQDKKLKSVLSPVMYQLPPLVTDKASKSILEEGTKRSKNNPGSGGLHLGVCLTEFCKVNKLGLDDNWRCPRCREFREGKQNMDLWRLPDVLTFHIKRFNCSARWREKITTKVNFPLTGLDVSEWCHPESPAALMGPDNCIYDLIAVVNHYGSMTGGHYIATCKATSCGPEGSEEVAYNFNGAATASATIGDGVATVTPSGWRIGRKEKESVSQQRLAAMLASRSVAESAEPLWLQFDDELVEPIPPRNVVSEMAYVLFYRRRRISSYNLAKYSTLD